MLKERDRKRGTRTKSEKEKKGRRKSFLLFLTFRSRASLSISLFKHYVIASQSQRRLVKALRHGFAISKEVQRKASLSLGGGGGRVIQLPGAPVVRPTQISELKTQNWSPLRRLYGELSSPFRSSAMTAEYARRLT